MKRPDETTQNNFSTPRWPSRLPVHFTPPEIAKSLGVTPRKVLAWIESGELAALNVANRGCIRPRYRVSPDALAVFEAGRRVSPLSVPKRRPRVAPVKDYFPDV